MLSKDWFLSRNFKILGGQPPNGTDRFPVIEIKSGENPEKGSRTSYKPDLVIAAHDVLLVVECKPQFSYSDVAKLRDVFKSEMRRRYLVNEIRQRRSLERHKHKLAQLSDELLTLRIRCCVAYCGNRNLVDDIYSLVFKTKSSNGTLFFGGKVASGFSE